MDDSARQKNFSINEGSEQGIEHCPVHISLCTITTVHWQVALETCVSSHPFRGPKCVLYKHKVSKTIFFVLPRVQRRLRTSFLATSTLQGGYRSHSTTQISRLSHPCSVWTCPSGLAGRISMPKCPCCILLGMACLTPPSHTRPSLSV